MKFIELIEYVMGKNLTRWNERQKTIWLRLVELNLVEKEDADMFFKFGEFFDRFYRHNNRSPTINETIRFMKLK